MRNRTFKIRVLAFIAIFVAATAGLFALDESSSGVNVPFRQSANSTVEVRRKGKDLHFITQNTRYVMHEFMTRTGVVQWLVLRETIYEDHIEGQEGSHATITVELTDGRRTKWRLEERGAGGGIRGEVVGNYVYRVSKYGCCDVPPAFLYFSLADGSKLHTDQKTLSRDALDALDEQIGKSLP